MQFWAQNCPLKQKLHATEGKFPHLSNVHTSLSNRVIENWTSINLSFSFTRHALVDNYTQGSSGTFLLWTVLHLSNNCQPQGLGKDLSKYDDVAMKSIQDCMRDMCQDGIRRKMYQLTHIKQKTSLRNQKSKRAYLEGKGTTYRTCKFHRSADVWLLSAM